MTHSTEEFEDVLNAANVVGVEYDETSDTVNVFVTTKQEESNLRAEDIVANRIDHRTDVIEIGDVHLEATRDRIRPIKSGASEGPLAKRSAGTGGMLARVKDPDTGVWDETVEHDDLVRISNNHVYAGATSDPDADLGRIAQPARLDGGTQGDDVGAVVGYVPYEDGGRVDVAARHADAEYDAPGIVGLKNVPKNPSILTGDRYKRLKETDATLVKRGRTTGTTAGTVLAVDATVNVRMGTGETIAFRNQILTTDMSRGGDSGSHVFTEDGGLAGVLFAGSDSVTVLNRAETVEEEFGIRYGTRSLSNGSDIPEPSLPESKVTVERESFGPQSVAYSFAVEDDGDIEVHGTGRSSSVVGNRVNGFTFGWSNTYTVRGEIVDTSFPDNIEVRQERVDVTD